MAILLQFNDRLEYTLQALIDNTRLDQGTVEGQLGILVKARVLLCDDDPSDLQGKYSLNTDYKGYILFGIPRSASLTQRH